MKLDMVNIFDNLSDFKPFSGSKNRAAFYGFLFTAKHFVELPLPHSLPVNPRSVRKVITVYKCMHVAVQTGNIAILRSEEGPKARRFVSKGLNKSSFVVIK